MTTNAPGRLALLLLPLLVACAGGASRPPAGEYLICDYRGQPLREQTILTLAEQGDDDLSATLHTERDAAAGVEEAPDVTATLRRAAAPEDSTWRSEPVYAPLGPRTPHLLVPSPEHHEASGGGEPSFRLFAGHAPLEGALRLEVSSQPHKDLILLRIVSGSGSALTYPICRR